MHGLFCFYRYHIFRQTDMNNYFPGPWNSLLRLGCIKTYHYHRGIDIHKPAILGYPGYRLVLTHSHIMPHPYCCQAAVLMGRSVCPVAVVGACAACAGAAAGFMGRCSSHDERHCGFTSQLSKLIRVSA